jgi:hypothetical protein
MTAYSDVPQVNTLYAEQERVRSAIAMLEDGGTMPNFSVGPAPNFSVGPAPPPPNTPVPMMAVIITLTEIIDDPLRQALIATLRKQEEAIAAELKKLGVTDIKRAR